MDRTDRADCEATGEDGPQQTESAPTKLHSRTTVGPNAEDLVRLRRSLKLTPTLFWAQLAIPVEVGQAYENGSRRLDAPMRRLLCLVFPELEHAAAPLAEEAVAVATNRVVTEEDQQLLRFLDAHPLVRRHLLLALARPPLPRYVTQPKQPKSKGRPRLERKVFICPICDGPFDRTPSEYQPDRPTTCGGSCSALYRAYGSVEKARARRLEKLAKARETLPLPTCPPVLTGTDKDIERELHHILDL